MATFSKKMMIVTQSLLLVVRRFYWARHQDPLGLRFCFRLLRKLYWPIRKRINRLWSDRSALAYERFVRLHDTLSEGDITAIQSHITTFSRAPLISVVMPVYNPPEIFLRQALDSIIDQIYPNWELCIADDASPGSHVRTVLDEYTERDSRIRVTFRERNGHICEASNSALDMVRGEYVALFDHDDLLPRHALYFVAFEINNHGDADIIYSDEDKVNERGNRISPYFKSDFNFDLFCSHNMISHLGVYRTALIKSVGGFRRDLEGSQDYDLALRCLSLSSESRIRHIPRVLYHWRLSETSTAKDMDSKPYAWVAGVEALRHHFRNDPDIQPVFGPFPGTYRLLRALPTIHPRVSIIIPTRDKVDLLKLCIASILKKTSYSNYEIVIVDNGSEEQATLDYFGTLGQSARVRVLRYDAPFNYSAINNYAACNTDADIIALLNNDIEIITPDWLNEMVSHALRPEVGAVGAKLLYGDGRVQHGGILIGIGGVACHAHRYTPRESTGYLGRAALTQYFSAVTGACLVTRRSVYEKLGGLDEVNLKVAYNDVDYCLRLGEAGYKIVWTPYAELYHLESATRGPDDVPENVVRFRSEVEYMNARWKLDTWADPYYNPNLTLYSEDFSLALTPRLSRPWQAFMTASRTASEKLL